MASLPQFTFLIISIAILQLFSRIFSTSRHLLDDSISQTGFRVPLKHVDSDKSFTKFELMQRAVARGKHRLNKLSHLPLAVSDSPELKSPIHSLDGGLFVMELSIGTPPRAYSALLDTGSDLIWTQCQPCTKCFDQPTPVFAPKKSSSFSKLPCSNSFCQALPMQNCSNNACEYFYLYNDNSFTQGELGTETFTFGEISVEDIAFGCGLENDMNDEFTQGAGLVGLGRGPLSLVSQLDEPKFSYCLTSIDSNKTSTLLMGSLAGHNINVNESNTYTTPLIKNPSQPTFYYLSLEGITIGATRIPIDKSKFGLKHDGSGGLIIDSGTTFTYLEQSVYDLVKKEFVSQVTLPVEDGGSTGLDLCFKLPSSREKVEIPKMVFNFEGADLDLPVENYFISDSSIGLTCFAMLNITLSPEDGGSSTFGYFQQQNLLVLHDLQEETLTFVPKECDKLS